MEFVALASKDIFSFFVYTYLSITRTRGRVRIARGPDLRNSLKEEIQT